MLVVLVCTGHMAHCQQPPPANVVVAESVLRKVQASNMFVATVLPLKRAVLGSAVDGRVVELAAREGQRVAAGQPLVQLLTETIELELRAATAELELRKSELAELENGSRPREIDQAKAKMLGAEASVAYTKTRLERLDRLRAANANSLQDFEEAQAAAILAQQVYVDYKAAYELMVEGPRPEKIAQARATVAMQQALVDQINDRIKKYTIIPRFDGYIIKEFVEEGAWVKTGDPVMEVVALDQVEIEAFVTEQSVPFIELGASVRVEVPALPENMFSGVVAKIVPQADTKARTFPVKILVTNIFRNDSESNKREPLLKPGMYARVELPTGSTQQAVMVPKDALVLGGPRPIIYVVATSDDASKGKAIPVPVETGVETPNLIQVKGNLKAGQMVVVEGNERLRPPSPPPGQDVTIVRVASAAEE